MELRQVLRLRQHHPRVRRRWLLRCGRRAWEVERALRANPPGALGAPHREPGELRFARFRCGSIGGGIFSRNWGSSCGGTGIDDKRNGDGIACGGTSDSDWDSTRSDCARLCRGKRGFRDTLSSKVGAPVSFVAWWFIQRQPTSLDPNFSARDGSCFANEFWSRVGGQRGFITRKRRLGSLKRDFLGNAVISRSFRRGRLPGKCSTDRCPSVGFRRDVLHGDVGHESFGGTWCCAASHFVWLERYGSERLVARCAGQ